MSFDRNTIKKQFLSRVEHLTVIPAELQPHVNIAEQPEPWALARRIVMSLLDNEQYETRLVAVMGTIQTTVASNTFVEHGFSIIDKVFHLLSDALHDPDLMNAFTKHNALVTLYFVTIFVMSCAQVDITNILAHDATIVQIAMVVNRLLLNKQVYQFANRAVLGTKKFCRTVMNCIRSKRSDGAARDT
jgi:hypothetical protein